MKFCDTPNYSKLKELLIEGLDMCDLETDEEICKKPINISNFKLSCL